MKLKAQFIVFLAVLLVLAVFAAACGQSNTGTGTPPEEQKPAPTELKLATTTSTHDSGLLDVFLPAFEAKFNYKVSVISMGTGAALEAGKRGDADVVLVHAKATELQMVQEGFFVDRHDVMYNDFVIVGPADDPVGIKGGKDAAAAFALIAEKQAIFVSRGDDSGTHSKEKSIWKKAEIEPKGNWYQSVGQGMGDVLRMTSEQKGYTLTDRGTFIALRDSLNLEAIVEGDQALFNQYGIMAPNPDQHPNIDFEGATALIEYFISDEGQEVIAGFQLNGEQLFYPNAQ
ncbi:MAG: substrate-binding domain-containing protein [Eubacteriales bacterium]|jgi:tungstate transport system substrate-binding protein|nr:extracellular solute-binding protein [Bacillota bacterium]MBV1727645.1 extracellular solute-binding protein [Desulforudis sp.]MDP3051173.1 extracellular solute-binding protein [Eubacteriales bacterium]MDQ7789211.1 substrate-binding domain-containing protein [Clostridia bacterium]MBU4532707.1 extracellular solute-binding protein [Bacillota bacterium]